MVSEGAMFEGGEMVFQNQTTDAYGHKKLGGIGDLISQELQSPLGAVQQRQADQRHQPAAGLPGARRRP